MGSCQSSERDIKKNMRRSNKPRRSYYDNPDLKKEIVEEINSLRSYHQVSDLKASADIDSIAQAYSAKLAKTGQLNYSDNKYRDEELGEILYYYQNESTAEAIVEAWNKDSKNFKYNSKDPDASPFAQIVWKSTRLIGLGLSKDSQGGTYLVANFFPAGNIVGKYQDNVLRPKSKRRPSRPKSREPPTRGKNNGISEENEDTRSRGNSFDKSNAFAGYNIFCTEALQSHNKYRAKHHSPPLKLNKELCKIAQSYAEKILMTKNCNYSNNRYQGKDIGENLFTCNNGTPATGEMVTADWYSEVKKYNFKKDYQKGTGHFTQLIWKGTTDVGFGVAYDNDLYYVVANYYPPGNFLGKFGENVLEA